MLVSVKLEEARERTRNLGYLDNWQDNGAVSDGSWLRFSY